MSGFCDWVFGIGANPFAMGYGNLKLCALPMRDSVVSELQ